MLETLLPHCRVRPHAPAFTLGETTLTFGALWTQAQRHASWLLEAGIQPGDRVACLLPTCLEVPIALLGAYLAGAVHVPINTRYGRAEISHILEDAGARALVTHVDFPQARALASDLPHVLIVGDTDDLAAHETAHRAALEATLRDLPEPEAHDPCLFIYTSGTTGPSKGVVHTFDSVVSGIEALTDLWRFTPDDRLVLALPLFHVHGLGIGVHGTLIQGCHTTLHERFSPEQVIDAIAQGATIFMGVPTMYTRLVRALDDDPEAGPKLSGARLFTSGSAALSADLFDRFETHTGHRILERYGMSETMLTISNPYKGRRPGAIGFPIPGVEARVVDEEGVVITVPDVTGELQVRGAPLLREYWGLPQKTREAFTEDGWFRTGDAVCYDADGYLHHRGRRSVDILKCGGYKISAREIEDILATHPDLDEVAVVGLPDPEWGQTIAAAIVPREGSTTRTPEAWVDALRAHTDGVLADFKRVRRVLLLEALPRNALGKVQKHRILEHTSD